MSVSTSQPSDLLGTKRSYPIETSAPAPSRSPQKRSRVLLDNGRPPLQQPSHRHRSLPLSPPSPGSPSSPFGSLPAFATNTGGLLCLTPLRVQGWRKVKELEQLDDRELVAVVLEIEKRYRKLMQFEREEIAKARQWMKGEDCRRNLNHMGWGQV